MKKFLQIVTICGKSRRRGRGGGRAAEGRRRGGEKAEKVGERATKGGGRVEESQQKDLTRRPGCDIVLRKIMMRAGENDVPLRGMMFAFGA